MDLAREGGYGAESGASEGGAEDCAGHGHGWINRYTNSSHEVENEKNERKELNTLMYSLARQKSSDAVMFRLSPTRARNGLISETRFRSDISRNTPQICAVVL